MFGEATITYRYNQTGFQTLDNEDSSLLDEPAVTIDMYSTQYPTYNACIDPVFSIYDFLSFIVAFKTLDISKIILMCAAAHAQIPSNNVGPAENLKAVQQDFPITSDNPDMKLSDIDINLDQCTTRQYEHLHQVARQYDLLSEHHSFAPIMINHIYVSNLRKSRSRQEEKHRFFSDSVEKMTASIDVEGENSNNLQKGAL